MILPSCAPSSVYSSEPVPIPHRPATAPVAIIVAPPLIVPRPAPEAYYGLLTNPAGEYSYVSHGNTRAVTIRGTEEFRSKAFTLFSSFGGESNRGRWRDTRPPTLHNGTKDDVQFFCMTPARVFNALRLYLYGQVYAAKAITEPVLDADGDPIDWTVTNDDALMQEAAALAHSFMTYEMAPDWSAIPDCEDATAEPPRAMRVWEASTQDHGWFDPS